MTLEDFQHAFTLDEEAGRLLWRNVAKQHAERQGREAGAINRGKGKNKDYWQVRLNGRTFKRARVIFLMKHGRWPMPGVDHRNGDSLDDRPDNLRECDQSQNNVNAKDKARTVALPRGVYPTKQGKFMARVTVRGVSKSHGVYDTPEEASAVYLAARKEAFHEFA